MAEQPEQVDWLLQLATLRFEFAEVELERGADGAARRHWERVSEDLGGAEGDFDDPEIASSRLWALLFLSRLEDAPDVRLLRPHLRRKRSADCIRDKLP